MDGIEDLVSIALSVLVDDGGAAGSRAGFDVFACEDASAGVEGASGAGEVFELGEEGSMVVGAVSCC